MCCLQKQVALNNGDYFYFRTITPTYKSHSSAQLIVYFILRDNGNGSEWQTSPVPSSLFFFNFKE